VVIISGVNVLLYRDACFIRESTEAVLDEYTKKTIILRHFSMKFKTGKRKQSELLKSLVCGGDEDGLGAGSGSKNVKKKPKESVSFFLENLLSINP
jgi:hypothetical protein